MHLRRLHYCNSEDCLRGSCVPLPPLESGLALWPAVSHTMWWTECPGSWEIMQLLLLFTCFLKSQEKKHHYCAGDRTPSRHRHERSCLNAPVPLPPVEELQRWPRWQDGQNCWPSPTNPRIRRPNKSLHFLAINFGVVCYTGISNWKN